MAKTTIKKVNIQLKGYSTAEWNAANPVLADREIGILKDITPMKIKIGDGVTHWVDLPFVGGDGGAVDPAVIAQLVSGKLDVTTFNTAIATKANSSDVTTSLNLKADKTALAAKADATALTAGLAGKVDTTTLTTELAKKVDNTALATALTSKVDLTTLNTSLANKADISALNAKADITALGLKADTSALTSGLALKVDKTTTIAGKALSGNITLAKADVGLNLVDNTADASKPVSTAQATAIATKIGKTDAEQTYEVNIAGTLATGMVSEVDGSFSANTGSQLTGFLAVTPGQKLTVTFATGDFNVQAPIVSTGLIGYSSASYTSYVATILSLSTYNAGSSTPKTGSVSFIDEQITIPAGVNFIKVPNNTSVGLGLKVMTTQKVGTVDQSITQLYGKFYDLNNKIAIGGGSGSTSSNDFTDDYKDKLDSIHLPVISWDNGGIVFVDRSTGDKYRGFVKDGVFLLEPLATSLKNFSYPVGYVIDYDKMGNATYAKVVGDAGILTPENAMGPTHLNPGLVTGATKYIPKAQNGGVSTLRYDFVEATKVCDYAKSKGVKIHGNHLTWHTTTHVVADAIVTAYPGQEKAMLTEYLKEHIATVLQWCETNYPGLFLGWNVTNEAVNASKSGIVGGSPKPSTWATWFTLSEFWEITYTVAAANTTAKLFSNDYDLETSNTSQADKYLALADELAAKNITVNGRQVKMDGIGFQFHTIVGQDLAAARTKMKRFADLGYLVALTELDVDYSSTEGYTAAMAETQAQFYYDIFINYQRAVPAELRYGVMMWTITDRYYLYNAGKAAPGEVNGITHFPSLYDYYGAPKPAYDRVLTIPTQSAIAVDVYQDFIATGTLADISNTLTDGKTPLTWKEAGYTGDVVGINSVGLRAPQNSSNQNQFILVDYPNPDRVIEAKLAAIVSPGNRTTFIILRYSGIDDYIAMQATNTTNIWQLVKRSGGVDTTILATTVIPKVGDVVRVNMQGPNYTIIINNKVVGSATDATLQTAIRAGFKLKGYNDKFTTWETFLIDKLPS